MGLDTVELKGTPFTVHVQEGELVTPSSLIAEMAVEQVEQAGKKTDILVVLTNTEKIDSFSLDKTGLVRPEEQVGQAEVR